MATQNNQELRVLFALFDVDNSGTLTRDELKQLLQSPDPTGSVVSDQQLAEYLQLADTDNSGNVSVEEFVTFMTTKVSQGTYGLRSLFSTIDSNSDGSIEKSEFEQIQNNNQNLNQNLVQILNNLFQQDPNSKVTYEQFVQAANQYYSNLSSNQN